VSEESKTPESKQEIEETVSPERREFLKRASKMGFAVPAIASFAMSGMMAGPAYAAGNMS